MKSLSVEELEVELSCTKNEPTRPEVDSCDHNWSKNIINKMGTSQVGAILNVQRAKNYQNKLRTFFDGKHRFETQFQKFKYIVLGYMGAILFEH